jgi:hypothetical protein
MKTRNIFASLALVVAAAITTCQATAQEAPPPTTTAAESASTAPAVSPFDASSTRRDLMELLGRHPSQVARVLKLDPTLFQNAAYLAAYPELHAFLAKHPEVAHSPAWYLEHVWVGEMRATNASERIWREAIEGFGIFVSLLFITAVLVWIIRTLVQHRRWSRVSKMQAEVHNKLMDRFGTNEELLQYINSPAVIRFLETAPLSVDVAQPTSPGSRILWSLQAGLVIGMAGVGLRLVVPNINNDVAQPLFAFGTMAMAVGIGFILSAFVSFLLSRRLGLWTSSSPNADV